MQKKPTNDQQKVQACILKDSENHIWYAVFAGYKKTGMSFMAMSLLFEAPDDRTKRAFLKLKKGKAEFLNKTDLKPGNKRYLLATELSFDKISEVAFFKLSDVTRDKFSGIIEEVNKILHGPTTYPEQREEFINSCYPGEPD